ncbi:MAG: hypothetical protein ACFHWX_20875 [Bacteroidota bacterium]
MLQLFRLNDPYRLVLIFIILLIIRGVWLIYGLPLPLFGFKWQLLGSWLSQDHLIYADSYDYTGPLSAFVYKWLVILFGTGRWVHIILSTILIILQAGILNTIFIRNKAFHENTYVIAFLYVILMSGVMDFYTLSPQLMAITFIIISINNIFRRIDNQATDEMFLTSGFYTGIATFFYLPAAIFLISYLISFLLFSTAIARRLILLSFGALIVYLIIWGYFFWYGADSHFHESFFEAGFLRDKIFYLRYTEFFIQSAAILFSAFLSLSILFTSRFTNFQQKIQRVMLIFLISAFGCILLSPELSGAEIIFTIPSIAFFLTHYVLLLRRRWTRALIPHLLILLILVFPFIWMKHLRIDELFVKGDSPYQEERIMLIGSDLSIYKGNTIASPFIDEYVSRKRMEGLKYYNDATKIFDTMQSANADIIIDRWDYFPKMIEIFPELGKQYSKEAKNVYRKINN